MVGGRPWGAGRAWVSAGGMREPLLRTCTPPAPLLPRLGSEGEYGRKEAASYTLLIATREALEHELHVSSCSRAFGTHLPLPSTPALPPPFCPLDLHVGSPACRGAVLAFDPASPSPPLPRAFMQIHGHCTVLCVRHSCADLEGAPGASAGMDDSVNIWRERPELLQVV